MNVKRDESKKSMKSETRKKVLFSGSFADLRLGVNEKNHEQSTISVRGLMNAFKVIYYNRERCIIEFEEIIKNLYMVNPQHNDIVWMFNYVSTD